MRPLIFPATLFAFLIAALSPLRPQVPDTPISWRTGFAAAREESTRSGKPLFILFQCPHSKSAAVGADRLIQSPDTDLAVLLTRRFIPVRVTSLKGIDVGTLRFDYDLTLSACVVDSRDGSILARWGTHEGFPVENLAQMLTAVASVYANRKPGPVAPTPRTITDLYPAFGATKRAEEFCYHCHYVNDAAIAESRKQGTFRKAVLYQYPPSANIGLTFRPEGGNEVATIVPDTAASRAGIQVGDRIVKANSTPVYSAADLQSVLNGVPDPGKVMLVRERQGRIQPPVTLTLPAGWRRSDISWRPSQGAVPPILGIWEEPLKPEERVGLGIAPDQLALRITVLFAGPKWERSHGDLKQGDVIVAVGGKILPDSTPQQFHSYIRMNYEVGSAIPLTVIRAGKRILVSVPAVDIALEN